MLFTGHLFLELKDIIYFYLTCLTESEIKFLSKYILEFAFLIKKEKLFIV
jgi:hypothetical protein